MDFDNFPNKRINNILTLIAVLVLMVWAWKWFGPGSSDVRISGETSLNRVGLGFAGLTWLGVTVVSGGYLLWRFMTYIFWHKYFKGENPPDEPED